MDLNKYGEQCVPILVRPNTKKNCEIWYYCIKVTYKPSTIWSFTIY